MGRTMPMALDRSLVATARIFSKKGIAGVARIGYSSEINSDNCVRTELIRGRGFNVEPPLQADFSRSDPLDSAGQVAAPEIHLAFGEFQACQAIPDIVIVINQISEVRLELRSPTAVTLIHRLQSILQAALWAAFCVLSPALWRSATPPSRSRSMPDNGLILAGARPIAAELGVRPGQIYYWCKADLMPHFFVGRTLCADRAVLRAWVAERQGRGPTASPAISDRT